MHIERNAAWRRCTFPTNLQRLAIGGGGRAAPVCAQRGLVCHFEGERGPFVVILVGAMLVSGIETVWSGVEVPPYASATQRKNWTDRKIRLQRFDELGRFTWARP